MTTGNTTEMVRLCLDRLQGGDEQARDDLLACAAERLRLLTRRLFHDNFVRLRRWEETNDVLQNAVLRLLRALQQVVPESPLHFYRLSAQCIRRELIDLARHHYGPQGSARHHASGLRTPDGEDTSKIDQEPTDRRGSAQTVEQQLAMHEIVERLPEPEKTAFDLLHYQELTQVEAAALLGVDVRTVQRYWQRARLLLHEALVDWHD